ncbi:unnamed protein product, partial [Effrenium voratum]
MAVCLGLDSATPRSSLTGRWGAGSGANIMIATEFGGRGIDWPEVDHVVNFQMPTGAVCWLHRAGRTGRMGKRGLVTNFVGAKDQTLAQLIQAEVDAGKDLHELFSRKRRKRLRAAAGEGGERLAFMPGVARGNLSSGLNHLAFQFCSFRGLREPAPGFLRDDRWETLGRSRASKPRPTYHARPWLLAASVGLRPRDPPSPLKAASVWTAGRCVTPRKSYSIILIVLVYVLSSIGVYGICEGWGVEDSVYFSITALTTVGYGDLVPSHPASRLFFSFAILLALVLLAARLS